MGVLKQFYSAQEIADAAARLKVGSVPATKMGVHSMAQRSGWNASPLARGRQGREGGGGKEYHLTLLPDFMQTALQAEYVRERAAEKAALAAVSNAQKMQALAASAMDARQVMIMEARAGVVNEIIARVNATGCSERAAICAFLLDYADNRLAAAVKQSADAANDKKRRGAPAARQGKNEACGLSRGTISRWLAAYDKGGLSALAPRKTREAEAVPQWLKAFLRHYRLPSKPSLAAAYADWEREVFLRSQQLPAGAPPRGHGKGHDGHLALPPAAENKAQLPSLSQVRHAMSKLTALEKARGRMGEKELKKLKAYVARDVSDLAPASVYQADGKTFVAEVAHPIHGRPFRPEITTMIDAKTRKVVGWSASLDENALGVVDALRMAVTQAAIPAILYTDNGPGYKNAMMENRLTGFLSRLGITPQHARAYNSQAKGIVERFNRHWTNLSRKFPTYIGRDMDREAASLVHKTTRKEIAERGIAASMPSWQEFLDACAAMLDDYNNRPHRGLDKILDPLTGKRRHMTPNEAWEAGIAAGWTPIKVEGHEAAELFRPWAVRKCSRCLVTWLDNRYFAEELQPYHGKEVIVGYDIHDAGSVIVREISLIDGERQPGRLIAEAKFEGNKTRFVPISFEQAAMEKRARGRQARVDKKTDEIKAELRQLTLDAYATPAPLPIEPPAPVLEAVKSETSQEVGAQKQDGRSASRPRFKNDADYAAWLIANPERVSAQDKANIREDLLATHTMKDLLARQGIDISALIELART